MRRPPPDLDVSDTYDEPLERVDVAAFAGRVLAERLYAPLEKSCAALLDKPAD